jgi:hypothetical protein
LTFIEIEIFRVSVIVVNVIVFSKRVKMSNGTVVGNVIERLDIPLTSGEARLNAVQPSIV